MRSLKKIVVFLFVACLISFAMQSTALAGEGKSSIDPMLSSHLFRTIKGYGKITDVIHWIEKGADVNSKDVYNRTALMKAIEKGKYDIAEYLVDNGADFNVRNDLGMTALMMALMKNNIGFANKLRNAGAILSDKDSATISRMKMEEIDKKARRQDRKAKRLKDTKKKAL